MLTAKVCKTTWVFVLFMASCLWAANFCAPAAYAYSSGQQDEYRTSRVILLTVDRLTGEDFADGRLPFAPLFTDYGGAGFMHILPQIRSSKAAQVKHPLQLDAMGIPMIADSLQKAGVSVYRYPDSTMLQQDALFPGGQRVRIDRLAAQVVNKVRSAPAHTAQFFVIDFAEVGRVEADKQRLNEQQFIKYRQQSLTALTLLTGQLVNLAGPETLVMVAPIEKQPTAAKRTHKQLQPLFAAGGEIPAHSLLSSASTRRPGIVTSADAAWSIYRHLYITGPEVASGQPLFAALQLPAALQELQTMWREVQQTYAWRPAVIIGYGLFAVLLLGAIAAAGTVLRVSGGRIAVTTSSLLVWYATAVAAVPLVLFCLPMKAGFNGPVWMLGVAAATAALTFGLMQVRNLILRCGMLAALYVGAVIGDCLTGGQLAHSSVLSYDPVVGIRFYGIGNEYMGVVIGWFLLGCGSLYWLWPGGRAACRWLLPVLGIGLALFFAWPDFGANAGGTITAALAAAVAAIHLLKPGKLAGWGLTLLFAAAPVILMLAVHRHQSLPTHITMADNLLLQGDLRQLQTFLLGKLAMNFRLVNDYAGGVAALVGLGVLVAVAMRPNRTVASFLAKHAAMGMFIRTAVWAALAAFVFNDSGVVAAAMILLPVLTVTGMIILTEAIPIHGTVLPNDALQLGSPDFSLGTEQGH